MKMDIDGFCAKIFVRPGDVVYDIGTFKGRNAELYLNQQASVVHGFEPVEENYKAIPPSVIHNKRFILHKCALANLNGEATIFVPSRNSGASCLSRDRFETVRRNDDDDGAPRRVEIRRLDDLKLERASFWKIDAEGAELDIFMGGRKSLTVNRPDALQIELFSYQKDTYLKTLTVLNRVFPHLWGLGFDSNGSFVMHTVTSESVSSNTFHDDLHRGGTPIYIASSKPLADWSS